MQLLRWALSLLFVFSLSPLAQPADNPAQTPEATPEEPVSAAEQALAARLPATEVGWLTLTDPERRALLWRRPSYAAPPRGQVLILAGEGWPARRSYPLRSLHHALPEERWDSAALNPYPGAALATPEKTAAAEPIAEETAAAEPIAEETAAEEADTAGEEAAGEPAEPAQDEEAATPPPPDPDTAARAAIDAALAELSRDGGSAPVLVGLGGAARLALDWVLAGGETPALILVDLPGVPNAETLTALNIPTLDLRTTMAPDAARAQSERARRAQALGGLYQTLALPPSSGAWEDSEPLLVRRLRGWLDQVLAETR